MIPLIRLAQVDSTQAFLARHPELGICAVMADAQTAGRGRQGNAWESASGAGLWLSARLPRPEIPPGLLLQNAMAAVIFALSPCGVTLGLKWPNDIVARREGALVKVGGILGEAKGGFVLLGVGVNLFDAPVLPHRSIPPACLAELHPQALPDPEALALRILALWSHPTEIPEPPFRWPEPADPLQWQDEQGLHHGVCQGWDPDGRLRVETEGTLQRLSVGEVQSAALLRWGSTLMATSRPMRESLPR